MNKSTNSTAEPYKVEQMEAVGNVREVESYTGTCRLALADNLQET